MSISMTLNRAKAGHVNAQFMAGMHYLMESKDLKMASPFLKQAADQDHPEALFTYGLLCDDLRRKPFLCSVTEIAEMLARSSRLGFAAANFWLGKEYSKTDSVYKRQDNSLAQYHLKEAAKKNHGIAMLLLAGTYLQALEGDLPDKSKTMLWLQRAADHIKKYPDSPALGKLYQCQSSVRSLYTVMKKNVETYFEGHPFFCSKCLAVDSSCDLSKVSPMIKHAARTDYDPDDERNIKGDPRQCEEEGHMQLHLAEPHQKLKYCSCKVHLYCCKEHQIQDRERHRPHCKHAKLRRKFIRARRRAGGENCCHVRLVNLKSTALTGKIGWLGNWNLAPMSEGNRLNGRFDVTLDPSMNGNEDERTVRVKICNLELV